MHDLALVTDALLKIVTDAVNASPVWGGGPPPFSVSISGQHPETPTGNHDTELSLYLFHIGPDKFLANNFWTQAAQSGGGTGKQPVAFEPLSLDLWYMLSAQAQASYQHEQQVLGVAMQALHEHGTFTIAAPTPLPNPVTPSEATLVLESPTFDEMSRLWQSLGVPLRTTAQYRVSVVFLTPDELPPDAPEVTSVTLVAAPADLAAAQAAEAAANTVLPQLFSTRRVVTYSAPGPTPESFTQSPAATAPAPGGVSGQEVSIDGMMLADTDRILLISYPGGIATETDVTATWKVPLVPPYPTPPANGVPFLLRAPAGTPVAAGRYGLTVSRPTSPGFRPEPVPLEVAAWVDPSGGPLLNAVAGIYTLAVRGVPAAGATLRLGTAELTRIADGGAPASGQWQHSGNTITFAAPAGLAAGQYQVGLRVADVESDPAQWAVVP
jgi:Pvc16 N-terminal domain